MCMENGKEDDDCCAIKGTWDCKDGYRLIDPNTVCWQGDHWTAYNYKCVSNRDETHSNVEQTWIRYSGRCVNFNNLDVQGSFAAGDLDITSCQAQCDKEKDCTGITWYETTELGSQCKLMQTGWESNRVYKGKEDRYEATCYVKSKSE